MITGFAALREDVYDQPLLIPPARTGGQRNSLNDILRRRIRRVKKPAIAPKNDQPNSKIIAAAVNSTKVEDLFFQYFRGKGRFKAKETHTGKQAVKMIQSQPYSPSSYQHRFKKAITIAETPVVGRQHRLPGRKKSPVIIDKMSGHYCCTMMPFF